MVNAITQQCGSAPTNETHDVGMADGPVCCAPSTTPNQLIIDFYLPKSVGAECVGEAVWRAQRVRMNCTEQAAANY